MTFCILLASQAPKEWRDLLELMHQNLLSERGIFAVVRRDQVPFELEIEAEDMGAGDTHLRLQAPSEQKFLARMSRGGPVLERFRAALAALSEVNEVARANRDKELELCYIGEHRLCNVYRASIMNATAALYWMQLSDGKETAGQVTLIATRKRKDPPPPHAQHRKPLFSRNSIKRSIPAPRQGGWKRQRTT